MITYSYTEVLEASIKYFDGDELAGKVFVDKYALQNQKGEYLELTPTDMHHRLAKEFARIEAKYPNPLKEEEIFSYLDRFKYIVPQGSPMFGIGNDHFVQSLGNCFVVDSPYDSYGGIMKSDEDLANLMKRRCVAADSFVFTKEKSIIPISDIEIGMHVLSFNVKTQQDEFKLVLNKFKTNVEKQDRIQITYSDGTVLKTSKKHPILSFKNEYFYKNGAEININDLGIRSSLKNDYFLNDNDNLNKIGWLIGAHLGDGTCGYQKKTDTFRFRILGNEENVVKKYCEIFNNLTKSSHTYSISTAKRYKTTCWEYGSNSKKNKTILDKYLDSQYGKKTYTCFVPSFIKENNLWISFIAGLIDTDGWVRERGNSINIALCSKTMIDEISSYLHGIGVMCNVRSYQPKRLNEHIIYTLSIKYEKKLWKILGNFLSHSEKKSKILNHGNHSFHSNRKHISDSEMQLISNNYNKIDMSKLDKKSYNLLFVNISNLNKSKLAGIALLKCLENNNIISKEIKNNIMRRNTVKSIEQDNLTEEYIDIEVEDNNNFHCGNFGLTVIHNCGVGIDLSKLRPKGAVTNNAAKTTDGIGIFMERFSNTTREVAQSGRRGALIETIAINHPEVEKFITIKQDSTKVTGANVSVRITNEFMEAVKNDTDFTLKWPVDSDTPQITKIVKAKTIWNQIVDCAWKTAEPGLLFWDTIIKNSPADIYASKDYAFKTQSVNPCGELILGLDSCRLLTVNLLSFVDNPFQKNAVFNWEKFSKITKIAQRLMDDLVDLEIEKISKILEKIKNDPEPDDIKYNELKLWETYLNSSIKGRRTGTGITALGDCLAALNIKYGEDKSIEMTENIYKQLMINCYKSSCIMAGERGSFPLFEKKLEKSHPFISFVLSQDKDLKSLYNKYGRRNIALNTTAPTGSVSTLTQTSSGIEPIFLLSYVRRKKINPSDKSARIDFTDQLGDNWQEFTVYHHGLKRWMDATGDLNIKNSPYYGATSNEINWLASVQIQAVAQKYIDHSISKTCVTGDTLIQSDKGLMYLDELIDFTKPNTTKTINLNIKNHHGNYVEASHVHTMEVKQITEIELSNGLNIKVSPNERFLVLNEETGLEDWKYLEELSVGDKIKINN